MDAGVFNVFRDSVEKEFAFPRDGVHLYFLRILNEFGDDHRMRTGYVGRQIQKARQAVVIPGHVHGGPREDIAGSD